MSFTILTKQSILLAITLLIITSCNTKTKPIKVGYLPIAECLPLYVAKEKGFFEKHGLEVELVSEPNGPTVFQEIDAGAIDIGFSNVVTLISQTNAGKSYKSIFGATYETVSNVNHSVFGRANENISLENAVFGINAHKNIEELMLINFLNSKGVKISNSIQSQFKVIPFPQMLSALSDKEIEYACIVEPGITRALSDTARYKYVGNHYPVTPESKVLVATYVSTDKNIKNSPIEIEKFVNAMIEATDYINGGNKDMRNFIMIYSKIPENLINKMSLPEFAKTIDKEGIEKIAQLMYDPIININNSFISNPSNKLEFNSIVYRIK